jgi:hypothetical protein
LWPDVFWSVPFIAWGNKKRVPLSQNPFRRVNPA